MSEDKKTLFVIRDYQPEEDRNFILATFLKGLYYGDTYYQEIPKDVFMANYKVVVSRILDAPVTTVKVACLKEDPTVILGYSIYRQAGGVTVLDWIYVKAPWRQVGIGKSLAPQRIDAVSHLTTVGKALKAKFGLVFNPFLLA